MSNSYRGSPRRFVDDDEYEEGAPARKRDKTESKLTRRQRRQEKEAAMFDADIVVDDNSH